MPNFSAALFSAALAAGAWWAMGALDESSRPDTLARELSQKFNPDSARIVSLYSEALRRDSANPYRWTDLADALAQNGRLPEARYCFQRALNLNRGLPQIWLRDANFHFTLGETGAALDSGARVLRTVPDYDGVLFNYFDRMVGDPEPVLAVIGQDRRAAVSYTSHLVATAQPDAARVAWQHLAASGFADNRVTAAYLDLLLQKRRYVLAGSDWAQFAGGSPGQVFNGGFEKEPTGAAMDWVISPSKSSETIIDESAAYEGKRALHIRFQADENVIYRNVSQVVLLDPGTYELRARVKIDRITTDEGPRLQIDDVEGAGRLGVRTAPFVGTIPWTDVIQRFVVPPGSGGIVLRVVRLPSNKFDNKIGGDFWMDAVLLARL